MVVRSNIVENTEEYNEFKWNKLTRGRLMCLYGLLAKNDTGNNSLIHDLRCELRNFFFDFDPSIYARYEQLKPKA